MKIKCSIENLYNFNKKTKYVNTNLIKVKTRFGYKPIEAVAITAKDSEQIKIKTQNSTLIGSPDHLVLKNDKWIKLKYLKETDFIEVENGLSEIIKIERLEEKQDLLDLQVADVKEFYANGIVSHNSTIKEVIEFGVYGKVEGFALNDLPNRSNRNLFVNIKFLSKGKIIEIERGVAPAIFKLKVNGRDYDEAGKRNIQAYIEAELFEIPYHIFKNIIVLSINNFKSFLTMTPKDKREIIDRIFGFDILNRMTEEVKSDKKEIELEYTQLGYELNSLITTVKELKDRLIKIKLEVKDQKTDEINMLKEKIKELQGKIPPIRAKFDSLKNVIKSDNSVIDNERNVLNNYKQKLIITNKAYTLYENNKCPTCESDLTTKDHKDKKVALKNSLLGFKEKILDTQKSINKLSKNVNELIPKLNTLNNSITSQEANINFHKDKIVDLVKNSKSLKDDPNITGLKKMLETYETKKSEKELEQDKFIKDKIFYKKVEEMLSNGGIKQMVINNILPLLNNNIDEALKDLDVNFTVRIDNQFNCIVSSLGVAVNVKTLSTGETARINMTIILSLIKLIKLQYPTVNLLFLDEIFSNIDLESIDDMILIVKNITKNLDMNVFLVSHSPVNEMLFDKKIELSKINTFSEMKMIDMRTSLRQERRVFLINKFN